MVDYSKIKPTLDAIPTIYGWANPKTGEMLVSIKGGCENPVENYFQNQPWIQSTKVEVIPEEVVVQPEPIVEIIPEVIVQPEVVVEPVIEQPIVEVIPEVIVEQPKVEAKTSEFKLPKNIKSNVKS